MRRAASLLLLVGVILTAGGHALAQSATTGSIGSNYQEIRTWHELLFASDPGVRRRTEALRQIVRSGPMGERGLQRVFKGFRGKMTLDPRIPGVEKSVRLLASSSAAQRKGYMREVLYATKIHANSRFELIEMGRKLDRPWGKTDADILFRHKATGQVLRMEVKDYSLSSPLLNFEWVMHDSGCRAVGVKGGRSPA